jgi:hypothetical protein
MNLHRKHFLRTAAAALVAGVLGLSGCAQFGGPRTVVLGQDELQKIVEQAFPIDRRLLEALDVSVTAPRVRLLPERNRLATRLDIETRDRLFGGQWRGRLALDSALRYEPSDRSVRLVQVRVSEFLLDGAAGGAGGAGGNTGRRLQVDRLGAVLAERVLEDLPIYRLTPEREARLIGSGLTPGAITVTSRGVEITFEPAVR